LIDRDRAFEVVVCVLLLARQPHEFVSIRILGGVYVVLPRRRQSHVVTCERFAARQVRGESFAVLGDGVADHVALAPTSGGIAPEKDLALHLILASQSRDHRSTARSLPISRRLSP
jgi:hypothetical protein